MSINWRVQIVRRSGQIVVYDKMVCFWHKCFVLLSWWLEEVKADSNEVQNLQNVAVRYK